jgi:hypothetical protein
VLSVDEVLELAALPVYAGTHRHPGSGRVRIERLPRRLLNPPKLSDLQLLYTPSQMSASSIFWASERIRFPGQSEPDASSGISQTGQ